MNGQCIDLRQNILASSVIDPDNSYPFHVYSEYQNCNSKYIDQMIKLGFNSEQICDKVDDLIEHFSDAHGYYDSTRIT